MVENNDNRQQRDEDNNKMCRRYNKGKQRRLCALGRGLQQQQETGKREGDGKRKSKDKVENREWKRLMEWIEENGWEVLNGNKQGDEEGK
jgi:hypothetical protein